MEQASEQRRKRLKRKESFQNKNSRSLWVRRLILSRLADPKVTPLELNCPLILNTQYLSHITNTIEATLETGMKDSDLIAQSNYGNSYELNKARCLNGYYRRSVKGLVAKISQNR